MIGSTAAWRRMLKLWLPGLILLIANLAVLSTYRFLLAGQAQMRTTRVERLSAELSELQEYRVELGRIDPSGVPASIEVARSRLASHVAAVEVDGRAPSKSQASNGVDEAIEEATPPWVCCKCNSHLVQARLMHARRQYGPRRARYGD